MIGIVTYAYVCYSQLVMRLEAIERDDLLRIYSQQVSVYEKKNPNLPRNEILLNALLDFQTAKNISTPGHGQTPRQKDSTPKPGQGRQANTSRPFADHHDIGRKTTLPKRDNSTYKTVNPTKPVTMKQTPVQSTPPSVQNKVFEGKHVVAVTRQGDNSEAKGNHGQEKCQTNSTNGLQQCLPGAIIIGQAKCGTSKLWMKCTWGSTEPML